MGMKPGNKYEAFPAVPISERQWPTRVIERAPRWCSVDLRDGNQALIEPMSGARKRRLFDLLLKLGFREIEVGFPAASQTDFDFIRELIEADLIPDGVWIQVLTQAREHLIQRTFEALEGAPRAIVHLYNSTSPVQRRVVFGLDRAGVIDLAVAGARSMRALAERQSATDWRFEYSPESFTATELDFALEICEAVNAVWEPTPARRSIINLPATVEMATPNVFADQIEWFARHVKDRDAIVLSVHPHNDRGTAVAAAELAVMAGADRIEGTLFGNGERTGNVDLVTLALNLYTQGIDPGLDFSEISAVKRCAEHCNQLPVHPRHPYAGELVFTAFAGSHQDAIHKGFAAQTPGARWDVPYLPIDPRDLGRNYEAVIRVNSQSGKGGIAHLLERDYGLRPPRRLQIEFSQIIQRITDTCGGELTAEAIWAAFQKEYLSGTDPVAVSEYHTVSETGPGGHCRLRVHLRSGGVKRWVEGLGHGPIEAFVNALQVHRGISVDIIDYAEHAIGSGARARAVAYVEIRSHSVSSRFGVGIDEDIVLASLRAVAGAVNRVLGASAAAGEARRA
ncbi:MAG: 2-isopropylmalate synthase [Nitrococcus sp.]|nr:2-isopropylmalate synthase [Nitrococcus sp.]